MVTNSSATPTFPTAITLTSVSSKPARCLLFPAMLQCLLQVRIVDRHQGTLFQLHHKVGRPDADQPQRKSEIHPAHSKPLRAKLRRHHPVQIHQTHEQNEDCD